VHEGLQELVNLVPTMCEAAGVKVSEAVHGVSFLPALRDPSAPGRPMVFQERNWHGTDDHVRAVRTDRYRYIVNAYPDEPMAHPTDLLRGPSFEAMRGKFDAGELEPHRAALFRVPRPAEELYDLQADPHELHNLADDPAMASVVSRLREALENHEKKYACFGPERRYEDKADRVTGEPTGNSKRVPELRK
jgi:arylsulfatase A-like enzyme